MKMIILIIVFCCLVTAYAETTESGFTFIPLESAANRGFFDEKKDDGLGGWTDFGPMASLRSIPYGVQWFTDAPAPFRIIDPEKNNGKSVVVLSGPHRERAFPEQSEPVALQDKFSQLYFLHTSMYAGFKDTSTALIRYRIRYADGTESVFECMKGEHVDDWWEPPGRMPSAVRTYSEFHKYLIATAWNNPFPEKKIEWIRMQSTGNAIPILVAVTGCNDAGVYQGFQTQIRERIEQFQMGYLKIALIQRQSHPNQAVNLQRGADMCRAAKAMDADIALFPEMYNIGYNGIDFNAADAMQTWKSKAVSTTGEFVTHFQKLAAELEMAIVITYLEKQDGRPRNTAALFDRYGKQVLSYSKVHTCDFIPMEAATAPGDGFPVSTLDTRLGPVRVGMMICYDREFPESARILMLNGAELILTPNACGLNDLQLKQFQIRAYENALVTIMTNYAASGPESGFNGRSCMFHADGQEILIADKEEKVIIGEINLQSVREIRANTVWGNAFRRPHRYGILISDAVEKVFQRENAFGEPFESKER